MRSETATASAPVSQRVETGFKPIYSYLNAHAVHS